MAGRHVEMGARGQDSMGMKFFSSFFLLFSFFFLSFFFKSGQIQMLELLRGWLLFSFRPFHQNPPFRLLLLI